MMLVMLGLVCLSLGYSTLYSANKMTGMALQVRLNHDIRVTNIAVDSAEGDALSTYEEYDEHAIAFNAKLPNEDSVMTYRIKIFNFGNVPSGILAIENLSDDLEFELENYEMKTKLCDSKGNCGSGMEKEILIKIKYKEGAYNPEKTDFYEVLNIVFSPFFKVTFDAQGGEEQSFYNKEVMYLNNYGDLPTASKVGYDFMGWYDAPDGGEEINPDTEMSHYGEQTLYAHWELKKIKVTFEADGGNVDPPSKIVAYTMEYGDLPTATKKGYKFDGWYTELNGGSEVTSSTTVTNLDDHTLYAHYSNTPPTKPNIDLQFRNGQQLSASNSTEVVTVTLSGSTDAEEETVTYSISCQSCANIRQINDHTWEVTINKTGFYTIIGFATDTPGARGVSTQTFRIRGASSSQSGTGQFVGTTFDSGWTEIMDNLYISSYKYSLQIPPGHNNSSTSDPDHMRVYVMYKDGSTELIEDLTTNLLSTYHEQSGTFTEEQSKRLPVAIRFEAYSPHVNCVPNSTINYEFEYTWYDSIE